MRAAHPCKPARPIHKTVRQSSDDSRRLTFEILEDRSLLSGLPLPTQVGSDLVVDDWNSKVTAVDLGQNFFGGNAGTLNEPKPTSKFDPITNVSLSRQSPEGSGNSLQIDFNFATPPTQDAFGGWFTSLLGLTDTKVVFKPNQEEPPDADSLKFPDYYLDFDNIYGTFGTLQGRSVEEIRFQTRLASSSPTVTLKIELKDETGVLIFTRVTIGSENWSTIALNRAAFDRRGTPPEQGEFNWRRVSALSLIIERRHVTDGIVNPAAGALLVDNLVLRDINGEYPDFGAARDPATGKLAAQYNESFLDHVRQLSSLYFVDFASRPIPDKNLNAGGIIQDRSTFADLLTVGGAGFQLTSYVIDAERGYISRSDSAGRVLAILQVLASNQGPESHGKSGYQGFLYHFLGVDGFRKQNFDFTDTAADESKNTVELSTIDTALAIAGVITAGQYFQGSSAEEAQIRLLSKQIYEAVNWPFMLAKTNRDGNPFQIQVDNCNGTFRPGQQFYLGWKPNETRENSNERGYYEIDDDEKLGQFSSRENGTPLTLDYYTDEALLVALLAMASPTHPVDPIVWDSIARCGASFVKSFPGSLFTYQFFSLWLDTKRLGIDTYVVPEKRVNWFDNTRAAIDATRQHALDNKHDRATWRTDVGKELWGLNANESVFDAYRADAASTAALGALSSELLLQAENGSGADRTRGAAKGGKTLLLHVGESTQIPFYLSGGGSYYVVGQYSNDGPGTQPESIVIRIDGQPPLQFSAEDTRGNLNSGDGWNVFRRSGILGPVRLNPGPHQIEISVTIGDAEGVELDQIILGVPLETGVVTSYGAASSVVHEPAFAIDSLWTEATVHNEVPGMTPLLHPRFGFADAFTLDISDAAYPGTFDPAKVVRPDLRGPWAHMTGFAIDHGPTAIMIDNYLSGQFIPGLFMSHPQISQELSELFPAADRTPMFMLPTDPALRNPVATDEEAQRTIPNYVTDIQAQNPMFAVTAANSLLFTATGQPSISPSGTLSFTSAPNVRDTTSVTVVLSDGAGDSSLPQTFTITITKPHPWHNTRPLTAPKIGTLDVDLDGSVSPIDAVLVVNYLNILVDDQVPPNALVGKTGNLSPGMAEFLDTGGAGPLGDQADNFVSPIDAVLVINWLNANPVQAPAESGLLAAVIQSDDEGEYATVTLDGSYAWALDELLGLLAAEMANRPKRRRL